MEEEKRKTEEEKKRYEEAKANNEKVKKRKYLCETINVQSRKTYESECRAANEFYHKNQKRGDVKQHQYIISFSPEEVKKYNLTPEKVMEMSKEWANRTLSGHQTILYVHPDGDNKTGNLHVHVNINSVRIQDAPKYEWTHGQKKHYAEGMKHTCTAQYRNFMVEKLNEICKERNYDMTVPQKSEKRIRDAEYRVDRREKAKDPNFDTQKEELRQCIEATVPRCLSQSDSSKTLNEKLYKQTLERDYGIIVTESRGRFSYMHPDWKKKRKRPISDRNLGEKYRKENIAHGFSKSNDRANSERDTKYRPEGRIDTTATIRAVERDIAEREIERVSREIERREQFRKREEFKGRNRETKEQQRNHHERER